MKRSAPLRSDPEKIREWQRRSKPINPRSTRKQSRADARREAIVVAYERDGFACQAQKVWRHECWGGLSPHEPHKRSAGSDDTDPDQILTVCWGVNTRIEDDPEWARSLGLSVHSWEDWRWSENWGVA